MDNKNLSTVNNKIKLHLPILLIILTPTKHYQLYFVTLLIIFFFYSFNSKVNKFSFYAGISFIFYLYIFVLVRTIINYNYFLDDFKELLKIIFVFITVLIFKNKDIENESIIKAIKVAACLNLFVTLVYLLDLHIFNMKNILMDIYALDGIKPLLSGTNIRATGISPGPGEQGGLSTFFLSFFVNLFFIDRKKLFSNIVFILISMTTLLLSQSRSAILSAVAMLAFILFIYGVKGYSYQRKKILLILIGLTIGFIRLIQLVPSIFYFINLFLKHGFTLPSFSNRQDIWTDYFNFWDESPLLIPFGYGRGMLGDKNVFDNEYVYLTIVFGLIVLIIILILGIYTSIKILKNWKYNTFLDRVILSKIVYIFTAGIGLSALSDPKISILLTIIVMINLRQKRIASIDMQLKKD